MLSVIIPSYKNKDLLLANLKHNLPFLKGSEVIVVNDYPEEPLEELAKLKEVQVIENEKNLGFGATVNRGVQRAKGTVILLLNSDVRLTGSLQQLVDKFSDDQNLFAISVAQQEKNGETVGRNMIYWKQGLFLHKKHPVFTDGVTAWAEGGSSLISKEKFLQLGGFDSIYAPFYWEDIDLSYRAWKQGYTVQFNPDIQVLHEHESTIGKYFEKKNITTLAFRNQFLFIWKNISDPVLILQHIFLLPYNLLYYTVKKEPQFLYGFLKALAYIPLILFKRSWRTVKSDKQVLSLFYA